MCAAAKSFNPEKGASFKTYAYWSVYNQLKDTMDYVHKRDNCTLDVDETSFNVFYEESYDLIDLEVSIESVAKEAGLDNVQKEYIYEVIFNDVTLTDFLSRRKKKSRFAGIKKEVVEKVKPILEREKFFLLA